MYYYLRTTNSELLKASRSPTDIHAQTSFCISTLWRGPRSLGYPPLSHPLPSDASCQGFSSDQTTVAVKHPSHPAGAVRAHHSRGPGLQASIRGVVQHLPLHWVGGKEVPEWDHLWGLLVGTRQAKPAGKGVGMPWPWPTSPPGWAGGGLRSTSAIGAGGQRGRNQFISKCFPSQIPFSHHDPGHYLHSSHASCSKSKLVCVLCKLHVSIVKHIP